MPRQMDVEKLAHQLHENKILNLDTPIRSMLKPEGVGVTDPDSSKVGYAVGWEHYVVICGAQNQSGIADLSDIAKTLRKDIKPGGQ